MQRLHHTGRKKLEQFGPVVRERLVAGTTLLYLFDPADIETMYAVEGRYPMRRSHLALLKYRLDRPHMYASGGLLPTNGAQWWELRRRAQRVMSRPSCVATRLPETNEVCEDFVSLINSLRCPHTGQVTTDFLSLERQLFLELTLVGNLDQRLGCVVPSALHSLCPEAEELMHAAHTSNSSILGTDNSLQLWRLFNTPLYKQLTRAQDTIYRIALKYVKTKEEQLQLEAGHREMEQQEEGRSLSVLEHFILKSGLESREVVGLVCDILLAGIDTGAFSLSYVLHHLATNQDKQAVLAAEADNLLLHSAGKVTQAVLSEARYLKAVVKESQRLCPVSVGVGRILSQPAVIRGYHIPAHTVVVTQNQVTCRLPQYFPDPHQFLPERWLTRHKVNPFLVLPFGHGPRSCIGRRMAEQNLYTAILQIVRHFRLGWAGGELDCVSNLINQPDAPLLFTFTPRHPPVTPTT